MLTLNAKPKQILIISATLLLSLFIPDPLHAGSQAFSGVTTSIITDKSCDLKQENYEMTLVFDGEPESATAGWFYGKGSSAAEFKRISPTHFDVTFAVTRFNKLPPSSMELTPTKDGFQVVIKDHIPEDKEIRESVCFSEKVEANLKHISGAAEDLTKRGKELFSADLLMAEGSDLLWGKKDYEAAKERGRRVLPIYQRIYGKWSLESINAAAIITFALMYQERYDEALDTLLPYRKALPDNALIKEVEELILGKQKEQDDLFRYNPDGKGDIELDPWG